MDEMDTLVNDSIHCSKELLHLLFYSLLQCHTRAKPVSRNKACSFWNHFSSLDVTNAQRLTAFSLKIVEIAKGQIGMDIGRAHALYASGPWLSP